MMASPLAASAQRRKLAASLLVACALSATGCGRRQDAAGRSSEPAAQSAVSSGSAAASAALDGGGEPPIPPATPEAPPVVDLAGVTTLPPPIDPSRPRLAALGWVVPVQAKPDRGATRIGTLRAGAIVEATDESSPGPGCPKGAWRKLVPVGWVCVDGEEVSTELAHPIVRATSRRPDFGQRLPYLYGTCTRGGPLYARLPTADELRAHEPSLAAHLDKWRRDEESGAAYGLDVWLRYTDHKVPDALAALEQKLTDDVPWFLAEGARVPNVSGLVKSADAVRVDQVDRRQGRSFIHSLLWEGRRYNVTPDLVVAPADRFRPIRGSAFHGVEIGKDVEFPFALVRKQGGRKWQWQASAGRMVDAGELEWRSALGLTGKQKFYRDILHYETKEGFWVDDRHAGRIDPAKRWPKWAKNGEKWLDINVTKQVLVAYEGMRGVFATIVSSGEAGLDDPESSTATERGIFRIHTKHVTATMDSEIVGEEFELRDVPYVQYFKEGYAMHGAYWHDKFGQPKSHGCVNLAPEDARRLFFWTEPGVPQGWHSASRKLTGTVVFIHP